MKTDRRNTIQLLKTPRSIIRRQGTPRAAKHATNARHRISTSLENE